MKITDNMLVGVYMLHFQSLVITIQESEVLTQDQKNSIILLLDAAFDENSNLNTLPLSSIMAIERAKRGFAQRASPTDEPGPWHSIESPAGK